MKTVVLEAASNLGQPVSRWTGYRLLNVKQGKSSLLAKTIYWDGCLIVVRSERIMTMTMMMMMMMTK